MKHFSLWSLGIVLLLIVPVFSQEYPGGEFFGGASFASADVAGRENIFGWQISAAGNPYRRIRLVGDFGGQSRRANLESEGQRVRLKNYQLLWGPQFTLRAERATLFTNTVFGVAATHYVTSSGDPAHPDNVLGRQLWLCHGSRRWNGCKCRSPFGDSCLSGRLHSDSLASR